MFGYFCQSSPGTLGGLRDNEGVGVGFGVVGRGGVVLGACLRPPGRWC